MAAPSTGASSRPFEERSAEDLVAVFEPTLGRARSETLVRATVLSLGLDPVRMTWEQCVDVLNRLSVEPGIVGITARIALSRGTSGASTRSTARFPAMGAVEAAHPPASAPTSTSASTSSSVPLADIIALLAPSVGNEKAEELVREAARQRPLVRGGLSAEDALGVLEQLAGQPGLVGVTARFAKARFALRTKG